MQFSKISGLFRNHLFIQCKLINQFACFHQMNTGDIYLSKKKVPFGKIVNDLNDKSAYHVEVLKNSELLYYSVVVCFANFCFAHFV